MVRPVRSPECPKPEPEPDPNANPWASMPVVEAVVVMVVAVVVASEPMTLMPPVPMPATVGVSEVCTEQDQPHDHDEYPHPLLPCSHDYRLSLRVQMLIFPHIVPPISPELPRQSSICCIPSWRSPLKTTHKTRPLPTGPSLVVYLSLGLAVTPWTLSMRHRGPVWRAS
jgi:hypothetical protein